MAFSLRQELQKPPSESQQKAVNVIVSVLGIDPPAEFTHYAYWYFISKNMERSKEQAKVKRAYHRSNSSYSDERKRHRDQREADWQALNLSGSAWARGVLDGEIMPPSWANESMYEAQQRLRSLGYRSSSELAREREYEREMMPKWFDD